MILRELFYFDKETIDPIEDKRYDATDDHSVVKITEKYMHVMQCSDILNRIT